MNAKEASLLKNATICTNSNLEFNILDPKPEQVDIEDIAQALSLLCRWNGHCNRFYSVAEHSVRASWMLFEGGMAMQGLMHDAAEAYIGDIPRPFKHNMPEFMAIERTIETVLSKKFGYRFPYDTAIKRVDNILCHSEAKVLMPKADWPDMSMVYPMLHPIGWDPATAKQQFLDRYEQLVSLEV